MAIAPEPVPDPPPGSPNHGALAATVHEQLAWVVTEAVTLPPGMHGANSTGATEYVHTVATSPDCLTVNGRSATAIVAVRSPTSELRATEYETFPLPVPDAELTTSQDALLTAVHGQSEGEMTVNVPLAASLPNSALAGESVYVQTVGSRPACISV
jgi:hypothetical protein